MSFNSHNKKAAVASPDDTFSSSALLQKNKQLMKREKKTINLYRFFNESKTLFSSESNIINSIFIKL